jgi:ligand-binding sensor domain-containing protein
VRKLINTPATTLGSSLLLLLLCCSIAPALAQKPEDYQMIDASSGLPHQFVTGIVQDERGFMWFGTRNGLVRYDGHSYLNFTVSTAGGKLSSNHVTALLLDHDKKTLWIGTETGLDRMDMESYKIEPVQVPADSVLERVVNTLLQTADHAIWISTRDNHLYRYANGYVRHVRSVGRPKSYISEGAIILGEHSTPGLIWIESGTFEASLIDSSGRVTGVYDIGADVYTVKHSDKFGLLLGCRKGVMRFNPSASAFATFSLPRNIVKPYGFFIDHRQDLWILENLVNLWLYNGRELKNFDFLFSSFKLNSYYITCLFEDNLQNLWVGTSRGIIKFHIPPEQFRQHAEGPREKPNSIRSITEGDNGDLYIGGYSLFCKEDKNGKVTHLRTDGFTPYSTRFDGKNGVIWVATEGDGLIKYDLNKTFVSKRKGPKNEKQYDISSFLLSQFKDDDGSLLLGSYDNIFRYYPETNRLTVFESFFNGINIGKLKGLQFYKSRDGHLWIATNMGLFELNAQRKIIAHFSEKAEVGRNLSNNYVYNVLEDDRGFIWIATAYGLNRLERGTGKIRLYTTVDGLADNIVVSTLQDKRSRLWIATNNGLSVFDPATGDFRNFHVEDGLSDNEFNHGAFLKGSDGTFYFGGMNGVNSFKPEQMVIQKKDVPLLITNIDVYDEHKMEEISSIISSDQDLEVNLPYTNRNLRIQFALPDYTRSEQNIYAYMLEGFNKDWVQLGNQSFINFTALPPGNYNLLIKGAGVSGEWTKNPMLVHISVDEVFYKKWWFITLAMLGMGLIFFAIFRMRIQQIRQMADMRVKIASDLHDEVGSVLTRVAMQAELVRLMPSGDKSIILNTITESCRAAMANMRDVIWSIDARNDSVGNLTDRMNGNIRQMLEDSRFTYTFNYDEEIARLKINVKDRQNIYLIFKEAINNIVKYSNGNEVKVQFYKKDGMLHLYIGDNGKVEETPADHQGSGLRNMQLRAKRIHALLNIQRHNGFEIHLSKKI